MFAQRTSLQELQAYRQNEADPETVRRVEAALLNPESELAQLLKEPENLRQLRLRPETDPSTLVLPQADVRLVGGEREHTSERTWKHGPDGPMSSDTIVPWPADLNMPYEG